ncbi:putative inactive heme oxygenase 2, chloroplastic [Capsicum chinense]|nr:putative inactive heme oxygenase 2, chloroplastic [Capsicum chinense]
MATLTCHCSSPSLPIPKLTSNSSLPFLHKIPNPQFFTNKYSSIKYLNWTHSRPSIILQCLLSEAEAETETEEEDEGDGATLLGKPPVKKKRRRYRKQYPGEKKGITEEMRFVAMKFRNSEDKKKSGNNDEMEDSNGYESVSSNEDDTGGEESWEPSMEGFIKYLVDSKLVFSTIERIVDESSDVSYAYFRRTGLERAECISKDLEWFSLQGHMIPEPSDPGVTYANYLEELAEKTPRLFLSHFYNIYFSHIAGGQVIAKKAFERLVEEKELEFYKWEGDEEKLLQSVRESFNMLAKHWSRNDKTKCLREVTKAFRFMGQIIRLIIL